MRRICVLLALALFTASCVTSRGEIDTLSSRVWQQEDRQRQLQTKLVEIERTLAELETPMRSTQANLWAEIEALRTQTATLQGQMEELQRILQGGPGSEASGMIADLSRRVEHLDSSVTMIASQLALDLGPRPGAEELDGPGRPGPDIPPDPVSPRPDGDRPLFEPEQATPVRIADDPAKALYDAALQAFHARNYSQARKMWDEFARTFPQHELVSNALFWQGESFFQMGDFSQAVLAYQDVISKHPDSNKYAASLLKQGVCFFRLGKDRAAVLVLEDLTKRFPSLPEAARAKTILEEHRKQ